jgi:hypothetical protein
MPAIAPIEDWKATQKDRLSIYAMRYLSSVVHRYRTQDGCSMRSAFLTAVASGKYPRKIER